MCVCLKEGELEGAEEFMFFLHGRTNGDACYMGVVIANYVIRKRMLLLLCAHTSETLTFAIANPIV